MIEKIHQKLVSTSLNYSALKSYFRRVFINHVSDQTWGHIELIGTRGEIVMATRYSPGD